MYMHGQFWSKKRLILLISMIAILFIGLTLQFVSLSPLSIFLKRTWWIAFLLDHAMDITLYLEANIYLLHRYTAIRKRLFGDKGNKNQG